MPMCHYMRSDADSTDMLYLDKDKKTGQALCSEKDFWNRM